MKQFIQWKNTTKTDSDAYINLSDFILKDNDTKLLNLGINCDLKHKYRKIEKKAKLELLFQNLENL